MGKLFLLHFIRRYRSGIIFFLENYISSLPMLKLDEAMASRKYFLNRKSLQNRIYVKS